MKRLLTLLFLSLSFTLRAAPITGTTDVVSAYVFRGAQLATTSVQPSITATFGDAYATAWANRSLQPAESSELDLTLGGTHGPFDGGLTAYTYPGRGQTTWEPYIGLTREAKDVKASLYVYRDLTLNVTTFEGKASGEFFSTKRLVASFEAAIGTAHGRDLPAYTYWSAGPTLKGKLGRFGLSVGVQYVSSSGAGLKRDLLVTKIGASF